jgi:hypothetical protein
MFYNIRPRLSYAIFPFDVTNIRLVSHLVIVILYKGILAIALLMSSVLLDMVVNLVYS